MFGEPNCEGGELKASAEKLTIGDTLDPTGPGQYSFDAAADEVTFHPVKEDCSGDRPAWFNETTWQRVS